MIAAKQGVPQWVVGMLITTFLAVSGALFSIGVTYGDVQDTKEDVTKLEEAIVEASEDRQQMIRQQDRSWYVLDQLAKKNGIYVPQKYDTE